MAGAADFYGCDCCGAMVPREQIAVVFAYGIETGACETCRGVEPDAVNLTADRSYEAAKALVDRLVADPADRCELLIAIIEYGKAEAFGAIDAIAARLDARGA